MKLMNLTAVVLGLSLCAVELSAWERSAMSTCKQHHQECMKDAKSCTSDPATCKEQKAKCKPVMKDCKEDAPSADANSFAMACSNYYRNRFNKMTMNEKKQIMDMADKNKMAPDEAVKQMMEKTEQSAS
jgi:hypothetical protein